MAKNARVETMLTARIVLDDGTTRSCTPEMAKQFDEARARRRENDERVAAMIRCMGPRTRTNQFAGWIGA